MNWLKNCSVSRKLAVLIAVSALFLTTVAAGGYYYLEKSDAALDEMYNERMQPALWMTENRTHARVTHAALLEIMLGTAETERLKALIDERGKIFNDTLSRYEKTRLNEFESKKIAEIKETLKVYREHREAVINLASQNKKAEAYVLFVKEVRPLLDRLNNNLKELGEYNEKQAVETREQSKRDAGQARVVFGIIGAVAIIMIVALGFIISRIITKPLKIVSETIKEIAGGNLTVAKTNIISKDEVGQVGSSLDAMLDNLRGLIRQVSADAEHVAAASQQLTASAEQSAMATNQVAISIGEVASGAEQQVTAINSTTAIVEQMSSDIQEAAVNAGQVFSLTERASVTANNGEKAINKAVNQMAHIEQTVNQSAEVVTKLGERSKEIGQIVETISGIASQTNLLALNAAIEAARAGEQGRGFAVVAEEVRKLAEQAQQSSKEIGTLISEIRESTEDAVAAMKEGTHEVRTGNEMVQSAGEAFHEISTVVDQVSGQIRTISAVTQQLAMGSQQIVSSVREIDTVSKAAASQTQNVSAATEEQSATMEEIASSSQGLARLAQELQTAVQRFNV